MAQTQTLTPKQVTPDAPADPAVGGVSPLEAIDQQCLATPDRRHVVNWQSLSVQPDGGDYYIDVNCAACGKSGCLGSAADLAVHVSW